VLPPDLPITNDDVQRGCGQLMDRYHLESLLGQGSFGIIYACRSKEKGRKADLAVKLIDRVEATPEDIRRETTIQATLDHPNVLKVREVIEETCFVCIVMDRYKGGDLIEAIDKQCEKIEPFNSAKVTHIGKQILDAIVYIHSKHIMHRDIKPDNFLLDRPNIQDPRCRAVLADFGFACEVKPGTRLDRRVGTKLYWSPEIWDKNYALKADMWAVGVTVHGVVEGRFPFKTEKQAKTKELACNSPLNSEECIDFISRCLSKKESDRPTAQEALQHNWILNEGKKRLDENSEVRPLVQSQWAPDKDIREGPVNPAVLERRLELVKRLEDGIFSRTISSAGSTNEGSLEMRDTTSLEVLQKPVFEIVDIRGGRPHKLRVFMWQKSEEDFLSIVQSGKLDNHKGAPAQWTNAEAVWQILAEHGIDTSKFGARGSKTLDQFYEEIEGGTAQLMLDATKHKTLVLVIQMVQLRIIKITDQGKQVLVITLESSTPKGMNSGGARLPSARKEPHESIRTVVDRIVTATFGEPFPVDFDYAHTEVFEEEEDAESQTYPGVRTIARNQIVEGMVVSKSAVPKGKNPSEKLIWCTEKAADALRVRLWGAAEGADASSLVAPPVGMNTEDLASYLEANNFEVSKFGDDPEVPLRELSNELMRGACTLIKRPDGTVARFVDVLQLKISRNGEFLVVTRETPLNQRKGRTPPPNMKPSPTTETKRLPGCKKRPDENQYITVKRILRQQLRISENMVEIDNSNVDVTDVEMSTQAYPGLMTVYRRRLISVELTAKPPNAANLAINGMQSRHAAL